MSKDDHARILTSLLEADRALSQALNQRGEALTALRALREAEPNSFFPAPKAAEVVRTAVLAAGAFPKESARHVFREVLSGSAALLAPRTVSVAGALGGFSHAAAWLALGRSVTLRPRETVGEVIDDVIRQRAQHAVVPIEAANEGVFTNTLNALLVSEAKLVGEVRVPVRFDVLGGESTTLDSIEELHGSPSAISACQRFVTERGWRVVDLTSEELLAESAKRALSEPKMAVLGAPVMGELFELRAVFERAEDVHDLVTRYGVIGSRFPSRTGRDRSVIAMVVRDGPGALHESLVPFATGEINMTRLESRSGAHGVTFFVEFDGHVTDRAVVTALEQLRDLTKLMYVIGSYPRPATEAA